VDADSAGPEQLPYRDKRRENMDEDGTSAKLHVGDTRREYKKRRWWGSFDLGGL